MITILLIIKKILKINRMINH